MSFALLAVLLSLVTAAGVVVAMRSGRPLIPALCAGSFMVILQNRGYYRYTSDDSYISYRYARNLAEGHGLVWNIGEQVEGYSNFLWVVLLAGFDRVDIDIAFGATYAGLFLAISCLLVAYVLAESIALGGTKGRAGVIAVLLLAAFSSWGLWSGAGLEPPLLGLLLASAIVLQLRPQRDNRTRIASAGCWALACMTRPETLLFAGVAVGFEAWEATRMRERARAVKDLALFVTPFAALFGAWFAWRYATYGWLFPNTYYVKVEAGREQYRDGALYARDFAVGYGVWLAVPLIPALIKFQRLQTRETVYVGSLLACSFAYVVYVGGDYMPHFRFFAPVLPLYAALLGACLGALSPSSTGSTARPREWAGALMVWTCVMFILLTSHAASSSPIDVREERARMDERVEIGRWLRANVPPNTRIAIATAGAIPFESRLTAIDMLGLNDEHIAHHPTAVVLNAAAGHQKYDSRYVLAKKPDMIILQSALTDRQFGLDDYRRSPDALVPGVSDMLKQPELTKSYVPVAVEIRPGVWFNFFLRSDIELAFPLSRRS